MVRTLRTLTFCAAAAGILAAASASPASAAGSSSVGADYSWYRPSTAQLNSAHVGFVARYLVPRSFGSGKALTASEARTLRANGRTVLLNYEWTTTSALGGYSAGVRDAQRAETARREVGAPALPIYFSIDFNATRGQQGAINAYLDGAATVVGRPRVGAYGGYYPLSRAFDAGKLAYGWQTYAWSGGRWDARAQVRQTRNGALWGGQADLDRAVSLAFGGWGGVPGGGMVAPSGPVMYPPAPAPAVNVPLAFRTYTVKRGDTLSSIAYRCGTTWQHLAAINHLSNPNRVYPGQRLVTSGSAPAPSSGSTYRVVRGDYLARIAAQHGTTWQHLAALNGLRNPNRVYPGEALRLR